MDENMKKIESERIVNIADLEQIIAEARTDMIYLKKALKNDNKEASRHLAEQLDLKLHRMEAFDFIIERRVVTLQ